jgi:hypothetical protein
MFHSTALETELGRQLQQDRLAALGRPPHDLLLAAEPRRSPRLRRLRALPQRVRRVL